MQYVLRELPDAQTCGEDHAATDIYCGKRRISLVQFPLTIILGFIATGIIALLLAGFLGYVANVCGSAATIVENGKTVCWHDPWYRVLSLKEPWPLYLWFSGLMVLLQVSILRSQLRRLVLTLVVTAVSILIVAIVYLLGPGAVEQYFISYPDGLIYNPLTYTLLNFGLILAFIIDSVRRWLGYGRTELNPARMQDLQSADPSRSLALRRAKIGELVSGDLIAGMVLCAVLAIAFTPSFLQGFFALISGTTFDCGASIGTPTIVHIASSTTAHCPIPGPHNSVTVGAWFPLLGGKLIWQIDRFIAVLCLVPGIGVLANTAFIRGLDPLARAASPGSSLVTQPGDTTGQVVAGQVGMAVLDALREALQRYILPYARRTVLSLRNVLWPALVLIGSFSFALCARFIQYYLHHYDPTFYCSPDLNLAHCQLANPYTYLAFAAAFGVAGFACTILSVALLVASGRIVSNTLRFLGRVGFVVLLTFWMFALALFGLNWFLLDTGLVPTALAVPPSQGAALCQYPSWRLMLAPPHPQCAQPFSVSWVTAISFAALIVAVLALLPRVRAGLPASVAIRAGGASVRSAASTAS